MAHQFFSVRMGFWGLVISLTMVVCAFSVEGFLGRAWWVFDLTTHFRVQYAACLVLAVIALLIGKKWRWAIAPGIFALVNVVVILPSFFGGGKQGAATSKRIRVLAANVLQSNSRYDKVQELVRSLDPDVVVLMEFSSAWMKGLISLGEKYPYVVSSPREDAFGIALFSRLPLEEPEVLDIGGAGLPTVVARVQVGDHEMTLVATHPLPPMNGGYSRHRNRQLEAVAEKIRSIKGPVMLVGDLNVSPWSPHFKRLLRVGGLRDSRRGRGIQATWPVQLLPLRIPIDHCLYSPGIAILRRDVGPKIGSDHFPVIVDFCLAEDRD